MLKVKVRCNLRTTSYHFEAFETLNFIAIIIIYTVILFQVQTFLGPVDL